MKLYAGTSGYSYKEWKGKFYPEKITTDAMLAYYSSQFNTVELNNTFYRAPTSENLQKWSQSVPEEFVFSLKASKKITHISRLKESCRPTLEYLLKTERVLGQHLGPTLFQLPPNSKKDSERLREFISWLPQDLRYTFEFRNTSWFDEEIFSILHENNIALCYSDGEVEGEPFQPTTDWGYLRLRRVEYEDNMLKNWVDKIKKTGWKKTFVYFKHEDEATGPALAKRFVELF